MRGCSLERFSVELIPVGRIHRHGGGEEAVAWREECDA